MRKNYVNPSQHLGLLDKETFKNIEKMHQEYLDECLNELKLNRDNKIEYYKNLELLIRIENDFGDFYLKNKINNEAVNKYLGVLDNVKPLIQINTQKYINLIELVKAKLSNIYSTNKEYDKAISLNEYYYDYYKEIDFLNEKVKNDLIAISNVNLGKSYLDSGDFDKANSHFNEGLNLLDKNNSNYGLIINIYLYKARIAVKKNIFDEANSLYQFVLDEIELFTNSILKERSIDIKNEYGDYLFKNQKYNDALEIYLDIELKIKETSDINNKRSVFYSTILYRIGNIYKFKNELQKAVSYLNRAYSLLENNPDVNKDLLIDHRTNIANISLELKEYSTSSNMLEKNINYIKNKTSLNLKEKEYLGQQYLRLSIVKERNKDIDGAFVACLESFNIYNELKKYNSEKYDNTYLDLKNSLSNFYYTKKDLGKAEKLCLELLDEASIRKGPASKEFIAVIHERLIKIYQNSNYLDGLNKHYQELLKIYQELNFSRKYIFTLEQYSYLLFQSEEYNEALELLKKILRYANEFINDEQEINLVSAITTRKICLWVREARKKNYFLEMNYNLDDLYSKCEYNYNNLMKINSYKYLSGFSDMYAEEEGYLIEKKDYRGALLVSKKNLQMLEDYKMNSEEYTVLVALGKQKFGISLSLIGDTAKAIESINDSLDIMKKLNENEKYQSKIIQIKRSLELVKKLNKKVE